MLCCAVLCCPAKRAVTHQRVSTQRQYSSFALLNPAMPSGQVLESICKAVAPGGAYIVGDMSSLDRWGGAN